MVIVPANKHRVIYFDFDCTLAVFHVWKSLAGYEDHGPNAAWSKINGPYFMQERGQLSRAIELGKEWSIICMGGESRLEALRRLLRRLHAEPGFHMCVMSKGCVGPIKKILQDCDLLRYFERIFAANYGLPAEEVKLPPWGEQLCAQVDDWIEDTTDAKLATINRDMTQCRGLELSQALLVDDDLEEIECVGKFMDGVHIKQRIGMNYGDAIEIMLQLGLSCYGFVSQETSWQIPRHPSETEEQGGDRKKLNALKSSRSMPWQVDPAPEIRKREPEPEPDRALCCIAPVELDFQAMGGILEFSAADRATTMAELVEMIEEETLFAKVCKKYVITAILARGRFGTTMMVRPRSGSGAGTSLKFLKRVGKSRVNDLNKYKRVKEQHLHPILEMFVGDDYAFVVTQSFATDGGDLIWGLARLSEVAGMVSAAWVAKALRPVAEALRFLHEQMNSAHGSVRPENIMLERAPTGLQDMPEIKLCDFAASRRSARQAVTRMSCMNTAPEVVIREEDFSPAADVWSFGVTLKQAAYGSVRGRQQLSFVEKVKGLFSTPKEASNCDELIDLCMQSDASKRPKFALILQQPFMKFVAGVTGQFKFPVEVCRAHKAHDRARRLHKPFLNMVEQKARQHDKPTQTTFAEYDKNGNGSLSTEEFLAYWESVTAFGSVPKPSSTGVMCIVDSNDDGTIEGKEFAQFHYSFRALKPEDVYMHIENAFKSLTGDQKSLTAEIMKGLFPSEQPLAVEALFDKIDTEGKGAVSLQVFSDYVMESLALK